MRNDENLTNAGFFDMQCTITFHMSQAMSVDPDCSSRSHASVLSYLIVSYLLVDCPSKRFGLGSLRYAEAGNFRSAYFLTPQQVCVNGSPPALHVSSSRNAACIQGAQDQRGRCPSIAFLASSFIHVAWWWRRAESVCHFPVMSNLDHGVLGVFPR